MNDSPSYTLSSRTSTKDQLLQLLRDLDESSGEISAEVERKKGTLEPEIYVELRHYLNSVNDALAHSAEAADGKKWESAKESVAWADTLLAYLKTALAMGISVSEVLNQWKTRRE